jgi:hypothetical protein
MGGNRNRNSNRSRNRDGSTAGRPAARWTLRQIKCTSIYRC